MLSEYREEAHYKGIGVGPIAVHEVDTGITQGKSEARIAREPVKVSDKQGAIHSPGLGDGREQLGPVILLATLDFDKFSDQLGRVRDERTHGSLLRFEAQTGGALLLSRGPYRMVLQGGVFSTYRHILKAFTADLYWRICWSFLAACHT